MSVLEREVLGQMTVPKDPSYTRGQMLSADALRLDVQQALNRAKSEDLVVFQDDKPRVAVVNIERYEALKSLEGMSETVDELRLLMSGVLAVMGAGPDPKLTSFGEAMTRLGLTEHDLED